MSACVPETVSVAEPLAPALMAAAPCSVTFTVPLSTVSWTLETLFSSSVTEIRLPLPAENASGVSSVAPCGPGTLLKGGL